MPTYPTSSLLVSWVICVFHSSPIPTQDKAPYHIFGSTEDNKPQTPTLRICLSFKKHSSPWRHSSWPWGATNVVRKARDLCSAFKTALDLELENSVCTFLFFHLRPVWSWTSHFNLFEPQFIHLWNSINNSLRITYHYCEVYIRSIMLLTLLNQGFLTQAIHQNNLGRFKK